MPVDLSTVELPRLPYLEELALIVTHQAADRHVWPPPGMARLVPFGAISYGLTGQASEVGWWWSTAQEVNPAITGVEQVLSAARYTGLEVSAAIRAAVEALGWVPLVYERAGNMDWIKVGIHAQLGSSEQIIHTFSLTANGVAPVALPADPSALRDVGAAIATAWSTAFQWLAPEHGSGGNTSTMLYRMGNHLNYDAVTVSVLRQTEPSPKVYVRGQPNLVTTVVPTERVNFAPAIAGLATSAAALPFEVACAVTLLTRSAGARNRGRVYLGGLVQSSVVGPEGLFTADDAIVFGKGVGHFIELIRTDTPWQVSICSRRSLVAHEVVRTATGRVPDAQRRRRGNQVENRSVQWVSPTI